MPEDLITIIKKENIRKQNRITRVCFRNLQSPPQNKLPVRARWPCTKMRSTGAGYLGYDLVILFALDRNDR